MDKREPHAPKWFSKAQVDLPWLVKRRSKIQATSLELYSAIELYLGDAAHPNEHREELRTELVLLIATALSLWRSVFLSAQARRGYEMVAHARRMLEIVIETNAVGFPQDKETYQWTGGFYNSNAIYRLEHFAKVVATNNALYADIVSDAEKKTLDKFSF